MLHVNIIMLHVNIVYLVCRGKEYATIHLIVEFTAKTTNNQSIIPIKIEKNRRKAINDNN